jgi:dipeptidyl aminopeptidase/acylaminoacyl peptidase
MDILPAGRRRFLCGATALGAGCALWQRTGSLFAQSAPALVPRRTYFVQPDYQSVRISPDGKHLAYLAPVNGVRNLFVAPIADPRGGRQITRVTDRDIGTWYAWAYTNRHIVFFQERDGDENWRASSVDVATGAVKALTPERGVRSFLQETSDRLPDEMLIRHNGRDRAYFDLFRVNIVTGDIALQYENRGFDWLITDSAFRLRLGTRYAVDGTMEIVEFVADGSQALFGRVPIGDLDGTKLLDFSADGGTLYLLDSRGRDKAALVAIDMVTRKATLLAEDADADIVRVEFDSHTRRPLAAMAAKERMRWHALDSATQRDLDRLAVWGKGDYELGARSADGRKVVVYYERDTASGEYVLLDRESGRIQALFRQRVALDAITLRPLQPVSIRARDGLELPCYLTLPENGVRSSDGRLPLVLVIHGGPYWRDSWGFSPTHQFLANRGYAVLSVNYRGSTGFGKAFVVAADREWGGRMHDDLIDAVNWAVERGVADPKRVGFYGASYGGYSALMAATKTPEVFTCIVDIFGVSNLLTFMATIPPYWGPWFSIWKNRLGDPDTESGRAFLRERSPLFHLERATRPLLIAQGMQDVRVVAAESEQIVTALKQKGVPVTYVSFADEGHGFVRPENRLAFYAVVEAFLAKHLGGRFQPVGGDFAGSSLKVETGGELVPGLAG